MDKQIKIWDSEYLFSNNFLKLTIIFLKTIYFYLPDNFLSISLLTSSKPASSNSFKSAKTAHNTF